MTAFARGREVVPRRAAQVAVIAAAVLLLDVLTKRAVETTYRLGEGITLVQGYLYLVHVRNPGVAFGMLADVAWKWRLPFFLAVGAAAGWLLWTVFRQAGHLALGRIALGLILGGAVGNFIDRMRYGAVVDFIDVWVGKYHWPTFNAADSGITVGTCLLIYALWRARML
jgi:signal peptidase II